MHVGSSKFQQQQDQKFDSDLGVAAEAHFAQVRSEGCPAIVESLRGAIKAVIVSTLGPAPDCPAIAPCAPVDHMWTDFYGVIRGL